MRVDNVLGCVGGTPCVRLANLFGTRVNVYCKMEKMNPASSIKDRVAMAMVEEAERAGELKPGISEIIEPTSGNTGIGLAMVAAVKRYPITLVMPEVVSIERKKIILAYGAMIEFTPVGLGMSGAVLRAREMVRQRPNAWMPKQFENDANARIHANTTAQELLGDFPEGIDLLITGVGTGGHISGCARVLKHRFPLLRVYAVEPSLSPVLSGGKPSPHNIQGIGPGFIPKTLDRSLIDGAIIVTDEEAGDYTGRLAREEGILAGVSTGASLAAVAKMIPQVADGATVLTFCYDSGERYLNIPNLFPLAEGAVSFTAGCAAQNRAQAQAHAGVSTPGGVLQGVVPPAALTGPPGPSAAAADATPTLRALQIRRGGGTVAMGGHAGKRSVSSLYGGYPAQGRGAAPPSSSSSQGTPANVYQLPCGPGSDSDGERSSFMQS